jgi:hypothetical protein
VPGLALAAFRDIAADLTTRLAPAERNRFQVRERLKSELIQL